MTKTFYSWNTKKTLDGQFKATVHRVTSLTERNAQGTYADFDELQSVNGKTRAIAKNKAIKWIRYYQAVDKRNAAAEAAINEAAQ